MTNDIHYWFEVGGLDCYQDRCENTPFGSVGGLNKRSDMQRPRWVPENDWDKYQQGYIDCAKRLYGPDWETCQFSWQAAITIEGTP